MKKRKSTDRAKCSLALPRQLWLKSKFLAMEQGRNWQDIVADSIKLYLEQQKPKPKGAR